jgi:hypothetical protein
LLTFTGSNRVVAWFGEMDGLRRVQAVPGACRREPWRSLRRDRQDVLLRATGRWGSVQVPGPRLPELQKRQVRGGLLE